MSETSSLYSTSSIDLRVKAAEIAVQIYYSEDGVPFLKMVDEIFQYLKYGTKPEE